MPAHCQHAAAVCRRPAGASQWAWLPLTPSWQHDCRRWQHDGSVAGEPPVVSQTNRRPEMSTTTIGDEVEWLRVRIERLQALGQTARAAARERIGRHLDVLDKEEAAILDAIEDA